MPADVAEPSCLVVPITSDKGLCGAVNSAIVREVKKMLIGVNRSKYQIFAVGEKGTAGLTRPFPDILKTALTQVATPYNYPTVMAMGVTLANQSDDYDRIVILFNEFKSAIAYEQR